MEKLSWLFEPKPHEALAALYRSGDLAQMLPEVHALYGVPQVAEHHPEIDTGVHIEMCLQVAEDLELSPAAKFAVLVHDLGKALTPRSEWPRHFEHERRGVPPVEAICERLAVPPAFERLALLVCEHHLMMHRILEARATTVVQFLADTGMERDATLLADFTGACEADKRGRLGLMHKVYRQGAFLRDARRAIEGLPLPAGTSPQDIDPAIQKRHRERLDVVRPLMHKYLPSAAD